MKSITSVFIVFTLVSWGCSSTMDSSGPASPTGLSAPDKVLYKAEKAQAMKAIHELLSYMKEPVEKVEGDYLQTKKIDIDQKDRGGIPTLRAEDIRSFKQIRVRALDKKTTEVAVKAKIIKYNPRTNTEVEMSPGEAAGLEAQLRREFFAALERKLPVSHNIQGRSAAAAPTPAKPSAQTMMTQRIQRRLAQLGYRPGPADGIIGKKTNQALKKFQQDNNLPATGRADKETVAKLLNRDAVAAPQASRPSAAEPSTDAAPRRVPSINDL